MVEAVTEPRGGLGSGHGSSRSSRALRQECQQRGRSLFAPGRVQTGEERRHKRWQVGSFVAACSGVFEAAGFSRCCGTLLWFA